MMKKGTAIFFILLANIILLAHAVVPHHYHQNKVCVNSSHCQSDSYAHQHDTSKPNHEHDGENDSHFCVLKQVVFITSNQWDQFDKCLFGSYKPLSLLDFQAVLFDNGFNALIPRIVSTGQTLFKTSTYLSFVSSSIGLRAPPVV